MKETITLPMEDFKVIFNGCRNLCFEYAGAPEIDKVFGPVCDKYEEILIKEGVIPW